MGEIRTTAGRSTFWICEYDGDQKPKALFDEATQRQEGEGSGNREKPVKTV